jgi:hypothetical protein
VLGPIENADLVGLDLTLDIHSYVLPRLDPPSEPAEGLRARGARRARHDDRQGLSPLVIGGGRRGSTPPARAPRGCGERRRSYLDLAGAAAGPPTRRRPSRGSQKRPGVGPSVLSGSAGSAP